VPPDEPSTEKKEKKEEEDDTNEALDRRGEEVRLSRFYRRLMMELFVLNRSVIGISGVLG